MFNTFTYCTMVFLVMIFITLHNIIVYIQFILHYISVAYLVLVSNLYS